MTAVLTKERPVEPVAAAPRETIFISHATPGDNVFATWLASRLSMAGYEVWCDQEKLIGGEDFWNDIEDALRTRTVKFILVISQNAFDENGRVQNGIQKEVALANILKAKLEDDYFVIPMRIDDTSFSDFSIDFLRLNGIDCGANWATGLDTLLKVLDRDDVVRSSNCMRPSLEAWRAIHQHHTRAFSDEKELLQSNWLPILELPERLNFYHSPGTRWVSEPRVIASECPLPCVDHHRLLVTFATQEELQEAVGERIPIKLRGSLRTRDFLRGFTGDIVGIAPRDAKNKVTSLVRQAFDLSMSNKGLTPYEMANGKLAWWFPDGIPEDGKLRYVDYSGKSRRRAVSGIRGKKQAANGEMVPRYYWHLGFTAKPFLTDQPFIVLQPRIIISEDGKTPLKSKTRMNSVRRSLTSMWFNDKWRGLVRGFASWLADGEETFDLPVAGDAALTVGGRPISFEAPVGIASDKVSFELTDEVAEQMETAEMHMRMTDPAFIKIDEQEDEK